MLRKQTTLQIRTAINSWSPNLVVLQSYLIHVYQRWKARSSVNKGACCVASRPISVDCLEAPNSPFKYILCDNGQNCFKHLFAKESRMLSFLSREHWRCIAGGRGSPEVSGYSTVI